MQNIPCEHIFLAMDVCFGGTFDPVIASSRGMESGETTDAEYLVRKLGQRTRKYLTSGGKEYVSDGIAGKRNLLKGVERNGERKDNMVERPMSAGEVVDIVDKKIGVFEIT